MEKRGRTARAAGLIWSLILGLGLILVLLWALMPHAAAEAQNVTSPASAEQEARRSTVKAALVTDPEPAGEVVAVEVQETPLMSPPADFYRRSVGAGERPSERYSTWAQSASGAPLYAALPAGPPSAASPLTPPLPGDSDFKICMTTDRVWGVVGPGETATVDVNGGQRGAAVADDIGFFWTTLYINDGYGSRVDLQGGDRVEIFHQGMGGADITLRSIDGQVDIVNDIVSGTIGGVGHPIDVVVYAGLSAAEPTMTAYSVTVSTDAFGAFTADLSGVWDFLVWEEAVVAYVEGDVEVHSHLYPGPSLMVRPFPWSSVLGRAEPGSVVTVTV